MMTKACQIAGTVKRVNQHLFRKLFISKAIELGISTMIWKLLTFKTVPPSDDSYNLVRGSGLKPYWEKIVSAMPLESKVNGRVGSLEEDGKLFAESLWELVRPIVEKKRLEKLMQGGQRDTVGLIEMEPLPTDAKEGLKLFLKMRRDGERQEMRK